MILNTNSLKKRITQQYYNNNTIKNEKNESKSLLKTFRFIFQMASTNNEKFIQREIWYFSKRKVPTILAISCNSCN